MEALVCLHIFWFRAIWFGVIWLHTSYANLRLATCHMEAPNLMKNLVLHSSKCNISVDEIQGWVKMGQKY